MSWTRHRVRPRSSWSPVVALLVLLALASAFPNPAAHSGAADPSAAGASTAQVPAAPGLIPGPSLPGIPPTFWGANYNFANPDFNNSTIASFVNATPMRWIRFPLQYSSVWNPAYWDQLSEFCGWIRCHSVVTVGGSNTTAANASLYVRQAEAIGIHPDYWVFGNEPNLWNVTPLQYANLVLSWIEDVRQFDPAARFIGVEISGVPSVGGPFISNVTRIDGNLIQAIAIQLYPQAAGTTVQDFMNGLTEPNSSIPSSVAQVRGIIRSACPGCNLPLFLDEYNGGSGAKTAFAPYREGIPDAVFFAASIIQSLEAGIQQFLPWTLTATPTFRCDNGLIELSPACDGRTLNPAYYLYSDLLSRLPNGNLTSLQLPGTPDIYAVEDAVGNQTVFLVANANTTTPITFQTVSVQQNTRCLTEYMLSPATPGPAAVGQIALARGSPVPLTLPALGVSLLQFSTVSGTCPTVTRTAHTSPASGDLPWIVLLMGGASGVVFGLLARIRSRARVDPSRRARSRFRGR